VSTANQLKILRDAGVQAVMMVGAYQACAALIRDVRLSGWNVPLYNVSFVGADQMLRLLREEEQKSGKKLSDNLIVTQVVPSYKDHKIPLVREYAAAIDKYGGANLPAGVGDGSYVPVASYSFGSLEGYLNARVFLAILAKAGRDLTRKSFYDAAERMGKFEVGGIPLELSPARHQALDRVWFTYVSGDAWASRDDPASLIH